MIKVLLFAHLRAICGVEEMTVSPADADTGDALWERLARIHPGIAPSRPCVRLAVNGAFAPFNASLKSGDEVVFIPPVSGG